MTTLASKHQDSVAFLAKWLPGGPWVLTAIEPDQRAIDTRTFKAGDEAALLKWLGDQGVRRNLYFSVNPTLRELSKKAEREDIREMAWLHVDIDPRVGEDIAKEQERALRMLRDGPPGSSLPPPTVIVFSGGGYQGFWKLRAPVNINGDETLYQDAKLYNVQLEVLFGADHCHNVDRIMRIPGTINHPNAKKRAKGRREALAEVVEWDESRLYEIDQFTKAPQLQSKGAPDVGSAGVVQRVKVSGNVKRFNGDISTIPNVDKLPGKAQVVIVQGHDPDEPNKFGTSRSEWLMFACCAMVRASFDDDTMYAVITDPGFAISASILDKGSSTEKYAIRQIERAKEEAIDPWLRKLNERHAVIANWNGKTRVIEEQYDDVLKRYKVTKQSFDDFRNRYMHVGVQIGTNDKQMPIMKPLGQWWLQHEQRRQFDKLIFAPGQEVPNAYNLWRGFACEARPGDCTLFLEHLKQVLCREVEEHYLYLLGWLARMVQNPDSPGYSAVVMRGGMGTGKSFVVKAIGSLFGRHYMQVTDPKHLVGSFNAHLRDCVLLFGEEAFYAGDKRHESILKMLITEELITIEAKGVDAEASANCVHLMMASNDQWVVPASFDDRRFFVLDVSEERKEDHGYFGAIQKQLDTGGREALLHFLLTYDLKGFNVRKVPKTKALQQQKIHSMDPEEEWWYGKLRDGKLIVEHEGWKRELPCQDLHSDFIGHCRQFNIARRGTSSKLGEAIKSFCPEGLETKQGRSPVQVMMPDGQEKMVNRPYWYRFPSLEECRKHWDDKFGGPYEWQVFEQMGEEPRAEATPF